MTTHHPEPGTVASYPDSLDQPLDWQPAGEQPPAAAARVMQQVIDGLNAKRPEPTASFIPAVHGADPVAVAARRLVSFYNPHMVQQPADFWAALGNLVRVTEKNGGAA